MPVNAFETGFVASTVDHVSREQRSLPVGTHAVIAPAVRTAVPGRDELAERRS
ncbi:hypothetical protein [Halovivax cerinus]|uniref:Uncharacterized protein n=1 Tax=Halovivax cerinus TaxID=1487865 RepID=A0ABD5NKU6_9EURY|nr:hypothetical protein [Halovivax cerinus]